MGTIIERREPEPAPVPAEPEPEVISEPEPTPEVTAPNLKLNQYLCQRNPFLFRCRFGPTTSQENQLRNRIQERSRG